MTKRDIAAFLHAFERVESGWACLSNLAYDLFKGRVDFATVFRATVASVGAWLSLRESQKEVERAFWEGVKGGGDPLVCQGQPLAEPVGGCSKVMLSHDLVEYHLDRARLGIGMGQGLSARQARHLEATGLDPYADLSTTLRTARPMAWVAPREDLEREIGADPPGMDRAMKAVNYAGLAHVKGGFDIVALHYPPNFFDDGELRAPTFVDGDALEIYRSKEGLGGWGLAVSLETHEDGCREAVHPEKGFTPGFTLTYLGRASRPARPSGVDFLGTFPLPWRATFRDDVVQRCVAEDPGLDPSP